MPSTGSASDIAEARPKPAVNAARLLDADYPDDPYYMDVSNHLLALGEDISFLDVAWCESVAGTLFLCYPNDELVPTFSQALGRGTTINVAGAVHTQEIQGAPALLPPAFDALGLMRK